MKRSVVILIAGSLGCLLGVANAELPHPSPAAAAFPADPVVGAASFEAFRCSSCHAVGLGVDRGAPNLGRLDLRLRFLEGAAVLWNHIPGMGKRMSELHVDWPALESDDLLNLVAFFTTYQYYLTRVGRPGRPTTGEALFRTKGCENCHSITPGESSDAPNLSEYGGHSVMRLAQAMWNHGPKMQEMLEEKLIQRPSFKEREMADLLSFLTTTGGEGRRRAYVQPGNPAEGAKRFESLGCAKCHAIRGHGGSSVAAEGEEPPPDLGRNHTTLRDYTDIVALMWNHAVPMQSRMARDGIEFKDLKESELADVVSFLFFVNFVDEPGDPATGKKVFEESGCAVCHAATGSASGAPGLAEMALHGSSPWEVMARMWRAAPKMKSEMTTRGIEWPKVPPAQMRHLVSYLQTAAKRQKQEK